MKLSIIIPVFNSSEILDTLMKNIDKHIADYYKLFEVILVNDCSNDTSWPKIKELKQKYNYIKGINLKENYGQHSAIFAGLKNCVGEKIVCMDDDMQHDPCHIMNMLSKLEDNDVCYVKYKKREHNYIKILISKLNNVFSSYLMGKSIKIYTSSFKCFNNNICKNIISNDESFIFLDYWIFKYTNKITYISVTHNKRLSGKTNYDFRELLTLWSKMIFLINIRKKNFKFLIIFIIKNFFIIFLKKYIYYKKNRKIEILEII